MTDRNLADLDLELKPLAATFVSLSNAKIAPSKCVIIVTWRDPVAQDAAHKAGLSNAAAGQSPHNLMVDGKPASKAFDFAIFHDGAYVSDGADERYKQCGEIAEGLGLGWGGRWRKPDYDHVEVRDWKTIA